MPLYLDPMASLTSGGDTVVWKRKWRGRTTTPSPFGLPGFTAPGLACLKIAALMEKRPCEAVDCHRFSTFFHVCYT